MEQDNNIYKYKLKQRKGITDLRGNLPEMGVTDWWTCEDWKKWEEGLPEKLKWNEEYIKSLKESGEYGDEYEITLAFVPHPMFDDGSLKESAVMSHRLFLLDLRKDGTGQ